MNRSEDEAIAAIYEAALAPELWNQAVAKFVNAAGGHFGQLLFWNPAQAQPVFSAVAGDMDPVAEQLYLAHYSKIDPRLKLVLQSAPCRPVADCDHFDAATVARMEIYQDLLIPFDARYCLATSVQPMGSIMGIASFFHREKVGIFSEHDKATLARLAFHIQHAVALSERVDARNQRNAAASDALETTPSAVLVVDRAGKLLFTNAAADQILSAGDGLTVRSGQLIAADRQGSRDLMEAIAVATGHRCKRSSMAITVPRPYGEPLRLLVVPLMSSPRAVIGAASKALILVGDGDKPANSNERHLQQWFGLTPVQASLALDLASGVPLDELAGKRKIKMTTLRSHLSAILSKTGTRRQAELLALFAKLPGLR